MYIVATTLNACTKMYWLRRLHFKALLLYSRYYINCDY